VQNEKTSQGREEMRVKTTTSGDGVAAALHVGVLPRICPFVVNCSKWSAVMVVLKLAWRVVKIKASLPLRLTGSSTTNGSLPSKNAREEEREREQLAL
jgi:hypothetical protein